MTIKTLDSKHIFKGKVIDLCVDAVMFPKQQVKMERINHPGGAAVVPLLSDGSVVLIKQYRHCVGDAIWEIPAGRLEPDESPMDCAKRELVEEVGFKATNLQKLAEIYSAPAYCTEIIYIFLATELIADKQELEDDEIINVVTVPFAEAIEKVKAGEIKDAKTVAGLLLANERGR